MCKVYRTKAAATAAVKKAVEMRERWEEAIHTKATREEMEEKGLKTVVIYEN